MCAGNHPAADQQARRRPARLLSPVRHAGGQHHHRGHTLPTPGHYHVPGDSTGYSHVPGDSTGFSHVPGNSTGNYSVPVIVQAITM
jgi:hypothetical protein